MKTAITTLSLVALIGFGRAAWAAENIDKSAFAGIPRIELSTRLNVSAESRNDFQPTSKSVGETAGTPEPTQERKVRIVYPLPK